MKIRDTLQSRKVAVLNSSVCKHSETSSFVKEPGIRILHVLGNHRKRGEGGWPPTRCWEILNFKQNFQLKNLLFSRILKYGSFFLELTHWLKNSLKYSHSEINCHNYLQRKRKKTSWVMNSRVVLNNNFGHTIFIWYHTMHFIIIRFSPALFWP